MNVNDTLLAVAGVLGGGSGGGGEAVLINKTVTANGTYLPAADSADGYKKVVVNVSTPTPTLVPKTITENGIYLPQDDGADGYDTVTVDVPTPSGVFEMFGTTPDIEGATSIQIQNVGGLNMSSVICGFLVFTDVSTNDVLESDVPPKGLIKSFVIGTPPTNDYLGRHSVVATSTNFYAYNNDKIIAEYYNNGTTITLNNGVLTCSCTRGPRILPNRPFRLLILAST